MGKTTGDEVVQLLQQYAALIHQVKIKTASPLAPLVHCSVAVGLFEGIPPFPHPLAYRTFPK
jgi:hypothetical protein